MDSAVLRGQMEHHYRMLAEAGEWVAEAHRLVTETVRHEIRMMEARSLGDAAAHAEAFAASEEARDELCRVVAVELPVTMGRDVTLRSVASG